MRAMGRRRRRQQLLAPSTQLGLVCFQLCRLVHSAKVTAAPALMPLLFGVAAAARLMLLPPGPTRLWRLV